MNIKPICQITCFTAMFLLAVFFVVDGPAEAFRKSKPLRGNFIETFDQDSDGKVSQDEFPGPVDHFTHLDQDSDGYIDETEKPTGPPKGRGGNPMDHLDKDSDGKISQDEFPGPSEHFTRFDENGDGYLEESELPEGPPKKRK